MNAKSIRLLKEARSLFWPWCAVALAGLLPLVGLPSNSILKDEAVGFVGFLAARLMPGEPPSFYIEVPPLRLPVLSNVLLAVEGTNDPDTLDRWFDAALRVTNWSEFRAAMKNGT